MGIAKVADTQDKPTPAVKQQAAQTDTGQLRITYLCNISNVALETVSNLTNAVQTQLGTGSQLPSGRAYWHGKGKWWGKEGEHKTAESAWSTWDCD